MLDRHHLKDHAAWLKGGNYRLYGGVRNLGGRFTKGVLIDIRVQAFLRRRFTSSIPIARPIHPSMLRTTLSRASIARPSTQFTRLVLLRRGYADAPAKSENLKLSLSVPHKSIYSNKEVYSPFPYGITLYCKRVVTDVVRTQVNLPSTAGDMGILSHHVPTIVQLKPGVVEIITEGQQSGEKYFGPLPYARVTMADRQ